jgi:hypothetical protein
MLWSFQCAILGLIFVGIPGNFHGIKKDMISSEKKYQERKVK